LNVRGRCAQYNPDPHLAPGPRDRICDDAVDAKGGKHGRGAADAVISDSSKRRSATAAPTTSSIVSTRGIATAGSISITARRTLVASDAGLTAVRTTRDRRRHPWCPQPVRKVGEQHVVAREIDGAAVRRDANHFASSAVVTQSRLATEEVARLPRTEVLRDAIVPFDGHQLFVAQRRDRICKRRTICANHAGQHADRREKQRYRIVCTSINGVLGEISWTAPRTADRMLCESLAVLTASASGIALNVPNEGGM
jgi:hypothetical protein